MRRLQLRFADTLEEIEVQREPDEAEILNYLIKCEKYKMIGYKRGSQPTDIYSGNLIPRSNIYWRRDDQWSWSDEDIYYFKKYHLALSPGFLKHGRKRLWQPPER